ncbi:hypothetical protein Q5M85_00120 [Paraclostridium bifermentans]|nr:hypothetical protein [Paraclostridium bifermentans]
MLYIDHQNLIPLQHMLMKIEKNLEFIRQKCNVKWRSNAKLSQE